MATSIFQGRPEDLAPDFNFIDGFLHTWDRFARGANDLAPHLKRDSRQFQHQLAVALLQQDKRAPSRLVFYVLVQIGGFIPCDSELGRACEQLLGAGFPIVMYRESVRTYFAGDLYFWWQQHQAEYRSFPLYDEWRQREFAGTKVIPMYERLKKQGNRP